MSKCGSKFWMNAIKTVMSKSHNKNLSTCWLKEYKGQIKNSNYFKPVEHQLENDGFMKIIILCNRIFVQELHWHSFDLNIK
jgi:hypothetical protein